MATDITPLLENSHDINSLVDLDVSLAQSNCHKYKITYSHPCTIDGFNFQFPLYLDAQFRNLDHEEFKETRTNRDGFQKKLFHRVTPILRIEFVCNDFFFNLLKLIGLHDEILVSPINPSGPDYEVDPNTWNVERIGDDSEDTYAVLITFQIKDSSVYTKTCCDDSSIVSFEDPCDLDGEGGGEGPPDPCADYDVSISFDGTTMTADVTGGPTGATTTYKWYYDAAGNGVFTQISTAGSINPVNPGVYRVVATRGTCQMSYDYELFGDCMDFTVDLVEVTAADGSPVLIADVNRFSTFEWYLDDVLIGGATDSYYIPTMSGTYKVVATSGDCEAEDTEEVTIDTCAHTVEITRDENTLTATVTGNTGTPTYQWYVDIGDGNGSLAISGATGNTYTATQVGYYTVKVTADSCDQYASYLILDVCVAFDVFISSVTPDGVGGVNITAEAINPPGTVNYTWYQVQNGVFQQIGTGSTINTALTGTVKVVATSGACTAEEMTSFCVDPGSLENYESQYGNGTDFAYEITIFTLPDPGSYTVNEINSMLMVFRNGVKLEYTDDLSAIAIGVRRTYFEIDFALNKIELDSGFPLKTTEKLEALLVNTP